MGFTQEYGIDYDETFAPVTRLTSVKSLTAVVATHQWKLFQMDVKNVFLNDDFTKEFDFTSNSYDSVLFIRKSDRGLKLLLLYVDDMIITGGDTSSIHELKMHLSQEFEMKGLGLLNYFLGFEVTTRLDGYYLSQAKYASDLISQVGLTNNKTTSMPLETNAKLIPTDGTPLSDPTLYKKLVGSLVYLTITRPDIAHIVHIVSQFMTAPRSNHYATVLHILHYIKGTLFYVLHFATNSFIQLSAYSDVDWASDPTDRRSTTGYCFLLGNSPISWHSKKQIVVSRSNTEVECKVIANTTTELI
ncbi:PREDICTED: uncharacterized protein LOC109114112 [Nelumbo nucifera]|uniref:Uncharacterized protein LOC109114112 n=1 Tax=Nelumbo nucifera TaxID=4432 RepID=A0A1U8Q1D9_NELNU|nr:PREDICTED: uncharacterized protein LOC109114112 [Nelumbo nucifera]